MDVTTIDIARSEARAKFLEYRHAVRKRHTEEDEAIMRGYRELSRGRQVLSIRQAFADAGVSYVNSGSVKAWLPRLAIARADARTVLLERFANGGAAFTDPRYTFWDRRMKAERWSTRLPQGTLVYPEAAKVASAQQHRAQVPLVPLPLRPADLSRYHTLWEAEWASVPVDPMLLRQLGGPRSDLYVVVAVWELTELERAVLGGRTQ